MALRALNRCVAQLEPARGGSLGCERAGLPDLWTRPVSVLCLLDYLRKVTVGLSRISGKLRRARSAIEAGQPAWGALKR